MTDERVDDPSEHALPDPPDADGGADADAAAAAERERYYRLAARLFSALVVFGCCVYVFWVVHPELVFRNTTPTGGDMGAHVWGPAYLRDELLPHFRLTGWTTDWYAGFPAYTFYMVVPSLAIVLLDVGFIRPDSFIGVVAALSLVTFAGFIAWSIRRHASRLIRALVWAACLLVPLLCIDLPYNIAFKVVSVSGLVAFPAAVWFLLKGLSLRQPGPELGAVASVAFLMDKSLFHIYGGNIASTMAGEFAFSLSITLAVFALGAFAMGLKTGRYRVRAAVLMALAMLCHVIPGVFFLTVGAFYMVVLRPRVASLKWMLPVGLSGGLMALWWYLPFYGRSAFLNDMGWEKLGVELPTQSWARLKVAGAIRSIGGTVAEKTSCDALGTVVNWSQMKRNLLPFAPHTINNVSYDDPNMWNGKLFFVLAGIGVVLSFVMVVRSGIWLTLMTATAALAFIWMPQDRFWNARVLPFYYLGIYLLAAVGVALLLRAVMLVFRGRWIDPPFWLSVSVTGLAMLLLWAALGMTLQNLPGGKTVTDANGKQTYSWLYWNTTYQGPVRGWAKWNFEGLEAKPGYTTTSTPVDPNDPTGAQKLTTQLNKTDSDEYFAMIAEMRRVGKTEGCGRAFWEYDDTLNKYGTPMAPMLLPYFTDHCIGSMEGLYFEASSTTPFHFLVQSELSQKPSRPERFDCHLGFDQSPYKDYDLDLGIKHLQMLGVKYYMTITDASQQAASQDARLKLVGSSGPWKVWEVANIDLVSPLANDPAVWTNVHDDIYSWARPAIDWFNDESSWKVLRASDGPSDWPRTSAKGSPAITSTGGAGIKVTNVRTTSESISFDVSKVGKPVLIRSSYFPNWKADGAGKVYRVTPNFMVVIPTSKHVTLNYTRAPMELIALFLSFLGALMVIGFLLRVPNPALDRGREYFGDRDQIESPPLFDVDEEPETDDEPEPEPETDEPATQPDTDEPATEPDTEPEAEPAAGSDEDPDPR
ncbi:MAG: hypothetical protein U0Q22_05250 [Acidimicrobiales bacterium]